MGIKTAAICIFCEMSTIAGMIFAFACGAGLSKILAGILVMLAVSLLLMRVKDKERDK